MFFFDSHVHIYPDCYNLDSLFSAFADHAAHLAPKADAFVMAVMLREFQPSLASVFNGAKLEKWKITAASPVDNSLKATDGIREIYLLPARQVAAKERIEALGLFGETPVPDGLPIAETIDRLRSAGYAPVLAWGLGKWLFKRAKTVDAVIASAERLFIGDSALRPTFWPTPKPYKDAEAKGGRVLRGSDPLPRAGDEFSAGRYAMLVDDAFDSVTPCSSVLKAITSPATEITPVGRRYGLLETAKRVS